MKRIHNMGVLKLRDSNITMSVQFLLFKYYQTNKIGTLENVQLKRWKHSYNTHNTGY
jgi:hypothetical protein